MENIFIFTLIKGFNCTPAPGDESAYVPQVWYEILQNAENPNSLYRMDLEYGKVVDEWNVHDHIPVKTFAPENVSPRTVEC